MTENNAEQVDAAWGEVRLALAALGAVEPLIYDHRGVCRLCGNGRSVLPLAHVVGNEQCPGSAFEYARSRLTSALANAATAPHPPE
jgi:hypothetical protein